MMRLELLDAIRSGPERCGLVTSVLYSGRKMPN